MKVTFTDGTSAVVEREIADWKDYEGASLVKAEFKTLPVVYAITVFKSFGGYPLQAMRKQLYERYGLIFDYHYYNEDDSESWVVYGEQSGFTFSLDGKNPINIAETFNDWARKRDAKPELTWEEMENPHRTKPLLVDVWMVTVNHDGNTTRHLFIDRIYE